MQTHRSASPWQLVTIELQSAEHADMSELLLQLDEIRDRLLSDALSGEVSADGCGFRFVLSSTVESVFVDALMLQ